MIEPNTTVSENHSTSNSKKTKMNRKMTKQAVVAHEAADVTRRMVCGGLAGMIAKVS
jgi:hypothetical protein